MTLVDFNLFDPDPMQQLIWGITGNRQTSDENIPLIAEKIIPTVKARRRVLLISTVLGSLGICFGFLSYNRIIGVGLFFLGNVLICISYGLLLETPARTSESQAGSWWRWDSSGGWGIWLWLIWVFFIVLYGVGICGGIWEAGDHWGWGGTGSGLSAFESF